MAGSWLMSRATCTTKKDLRQNPQAGERAKTERNWRKLSVFPQSEQTNRAAIESVASKRNRLKESFQIITVLAKDADVDADELVNDHGLSRLHGDAADAADAAGDDNDSAALMIVDWSGEGRERVEKCPLKRTLANIATAAATRGAGHTIPRFSIL